MSFVATAITTSVIAGATVYSTSEARKAQKKARRQAKEDAEAARRAEVFAQTKGKGTGQLGQVVLDVDDEDEDEEISGVIKNNRSVRI